MGAIAILDSPAALLKWAVAGPEVSRILGTIDEENGEDNVIYNHHEDTDNFEKKMVKMMLYITIMRIQTTLMKKMVKMMLYITIMRIQTTLIKKMVKMMLYITIMRIQTTLKRKW